MARIIDGKLVGELPPMDDRRFTQVVADDFIETKLDGREAWSQYLPTEDPNRPMALAFGIPEVGRTPEPPVVQPWAVFKDNRWFRVVGVRPDGSRFFLQAEVDYDVDLELGAFVFTEVGERVLRDNRAVVDLYATAYYGPNAVRRR